MHWMRRSRKHAPIITVMLGLFLISFISCSSSTGPEVTESATLMIRNNTGVTIDVYINGNLESSMEDGLSNIVDIFALGTYAVKATINGTDTVLSQREIDVVDFGNYVWSVTSPVTINVINQYGEMIQIFGNGVFVENVEADSSLLLTDVKFGDHTLEAKTADGTVVATENYNITEIQHYTWTITP